MTLMQRKDCISSSRSAGNKQDNKSCQIKRELKTDLTLKMGKNLSLYIFIIQLIVLSQQYFTFGRNDQHVSELKTATTKVISPFHYELLAMLKCIVTINKTEAKANFIRILVLIRLRMLTLISIRRLSPRSTPILIPKPLPIPTPIPTHTHQH